jgi:hypothetical protein
MKKPYTCKKCKKESFTVVKDSSSYEIVAICCGCSNEIILKKARNTKDTYVGNSSLDVIKYWCEKWKKANGGQEPAVDWGKQVKKAKVYVNQFGVTEMMRLTDLYFLQFDDKFIKENNWSLSIFLNDNIINKLRKL